MKQATTPGPGPGPTTYNIEVTDTFGHEPNYAWVRRYELTVPDGTSWGAVVRRAKRLIGWSGVRCTRVDYGDMTELRPVGECMVCFIT